MGTLVALAAAAPGDAPASEANANLRHAPPGSAELTVAGTNGYRVTVKRERSIVTIVTSRQRPPVATISNRGQLLAANRGSYTASTYATRSGSTDLNTIDADLGPLGRIAVTFQPSGASRVTTVDLSDKSERCVGATRVVRHLGTFTGTISFHGENGYTSVDLSGSAGTVGTSPFRNCTTRGDRRSGGGPLPSPTEAVLTLSGKDEAPSLLASKAADGDPGFYAFSGEAFGESVFVLRAARAAGPAAAFLLDRDRSVATIAPPAPFSGHATYRDGPHSPPRWNGDLAVEFPGFEAPLTGAGFEAPKLRFFATHPG